MKAILVLCLISLITCNAVVDFLKCLVSDPTVQSLALKIFSYIYTKDYSKILPAIINAVPNLYKAVMTCLGKEAVLEIE